MPSLRVVAVCEKGVPEVLQLLGCRLGWIAHRTGVLVGVCRCGDAELALEPMSLSSG